MRQKNIRVMRYIVPFNFGEKTYQHIYDCLKNASGNWEREIVEKKDGDIYKYIYHALDGQEDEDTSVGSAWRYQKENLPIMKLAIKQEDGYIYGSLSDAGLYIFRTGIGLYWYEIELNASNLKVEQLIECQNWLKELNRFNGSWKIYQLVKKGERLKIDASNILRDAPAAGQKDAWIVVKGGSWNNDENYYIEKGRLPKFPDGVAEGTDFEMFSVLGEAETISVKYNALRQLSLGVWVTEMLSVLDCAIQYYPGKPLRSKIQKQQSVKQEGSILVPDEALLFSYVLFRDGDGICGQRALIDAAWHLNNGYNKNFLLPDGMESEMLQPFKDAYWYASSAGFGCYVREHIQNSHFLTENLPHSMKTDYFVLYMLLLYQTYSLLHFAETIEYRLSAEAKRYLDTSEVSSSELLQQVRAEINTFLLKSVHTSVSHVQYQNDVYNYISEKLRIKEDVKSLTAGVDFLEELQEAQEEKQRAEAEKAEAEAEKEEAKRRQREDDRLAIGVSLLSILTVLSAFADGIGFLDSVGEVGSFWDVFNQSPAYGIILSLIMVAAGVSVFLLIYAIYRVFKNRDRKNKK